MPRRMQRTASPADQGLSRAAPAERRLRHRQRSLANAVPLAMPLLASNASRMQRTASPADEWLPAPCSPSAIRTRPRTVPLALPLPLARSRDPDVVDLDLDQVVRADIGRLETDPDRRSNPRVQRNGSGPPDAVKVRGRTRPQEDGGLSACRILDDRGEPIDHRRMPIVGKDVAERQLLARAHRQ